MQNTEKLADLVASLVVPDRAAKADEVDRGATEKTLTAILRGGQESLVALVDLLVEPGKGDDSKARYALHALALRVCAAKDDKQRSAYAEALASTLGGKRPGAVQAFVVRQLQVAGGKEVTGALGKLLTDEELSGPAAQALLAIRSGAAGQFRAALPKSAGKARLSIVHALGTLRDKESAAELRKLAGDKDRDTRLTALWALANAGDSGSVDTLVKSAAAEGYERAKVASASLLLAERLSAAGNKKDSARLYTHLRDRFTGDDESHIREAAKRGLAASK
jgi:HEAT repeat protein